MRTSQAGIALVQHFEGFSATPYKDAAGFNTIGYGHLIKPGEAFHRIDEHDAEVLLRCDLADAEDAVERLVKVPLNQCQFDALVSFTFNLGAERLKNSTLLKLLNRGRYGDVPEQMKKWILAGGRPMEGLKRRRKAEADLFLKPVS